MKFWLPLLAALTALPAHAEIYKCQLPNGSTEISNLPCPKGSETLLTHPDENVSEPRRLEAEREVERMRRYLERREAAQKAEAEAERDRQSNQQRAAAVTPPARADDSVEECLRALDQQILGPDQRAAMEADCRQRNETTTGAPLPVYIPGTLYAPDAARRHNERERRHPQGERAPKREAGRAKPRPQPSSVCPPQDKNCGQHPGISR